MLYKGVQKDMGAKILRVSRNNYFIWGKWLQLLVLGAVLWSIQIQNSNINATETNAVAALPLIWPLDPDNRGALGQDYAQYNLVRRNYYHTGLDIGAPEGTIVRAAASGRVRRLDMQRGRFNGDNHCMGHVVIIDHSGFFTLYAHLQSIVIADGASVTQGTQIGTVGRTPTVPRAGCTPPSNPHLHFEVKEFGVLGDATDAGPNWGYTPNHPDDHYYYDPIVKLHGVLPLFPPLRIQITQDGINLRVGPGNADVMAYRAFGQVNQGEAYNVIGSSPAPISPECPGGWYQIQRIDGGRFRDNGRGGEIPDAWVCEDFTSEQTHTCHQYTISSHPFSSLDGFGVPWNVFTATSELILNAYCSVTRVTAQIHKPSSIPYQYTFTTGYQWNSSISQWTPIAYQCDEPLIEGVWCNANASATLDPAYPFFIAFACSWVNDTWKCGCRDATCSQSFWQLQQFQR
jgi:murein DD-endopeptidase MepM/ murein hydrolase activator NlpD